jgi:cell division protein FtsI (penicillin-binding protein 3)
LTQAMARYRAIGAGAVVLNVHTGEVVAMASLPDYDPNNPYNAMEKDRLNRMSAGVYEMGSTFKAFTTAMALDSGKVNINSKFDARRPIQIARFTINDFHGKKRILSVPEVFIYSSNIGSAKEADVVGIEAHRAFLHKMGLLDKMQLELPEVAKPTEPHEWKKLNSITISFGHGAATTPLQTAVAAAALMNGGNLIPATFLPRSVEEANALAVRVVKPETSDLMRYLFRLNVEKGSGKRAEVSGYVVGGKTGTAEKVVRGRYSTDKRFNAFLGAFPMTKPEYVVLVVLDEPKAEEGKGGTTAGSNAAPTVGAIVRRTAVFLGVKPDFGPEAGAMMVSFP